MSILDRLTPGGIPDGTVVDEVESGLSMADLAEQLGQAQDNLELLAHELDVRESMADVELGLEDASWRSLRSEGRMEFTREGRLRSTSLCRVMAVANPLIKRGLNLRAAYVWGQGVQIQARATGDNERHAGEQDVNSVVQAFLDDRATRKVLTSGTARETNERTLGTDGMLAFACFTKPLTGRVQLREIPTEEITDIITNPDDTTEVWYYKRVWTRQDVALDVSSTSQTVTTYYPDIDYRPRGVRPLRANGEPIMWDAPVIFLSVNGLSGWDFGVGDAFAALPWARGYKEFLEDWAKLVKALSRFAWRAASDRKSKTQAIATRARQAADDGVVGGLTNMPIEAIPKSGATIDSQSGKPLAAMVASGLEIPVTMLLGDPGISGARATAETLDRPTELMATMRRTVWSDFHRRLLDYVIDQAVKAPQGALQGTVTRDEWDREVVTLAGETERTIDFDWPDLTNETLQALVTAIVEADSTRKIPPTTTMRLLLNALGVRNVDELIDEATDENGNWIDPEMNAGQAALDAFHRGEDPAAALRGGPPAAGDGTGDTAGDSTDS